MYNLHTVKFTHFKYPVQWVLVNAAIMIWNVSLTPKTYFLLLCSPLSPVTPAPATTNPFSGPLDLPFLEHHIHRLTQPVAFRVGLLPLSKNILRFIHTASRTFLLLRSIPFGEYTFCLSFGLLLANSRCFQFGAIMDRAALSIHVPVFLGGWLMQFFINIF